jgi:hypothetical protein
VPAISAFEQDRELAHDFRTDVSWQADREFCLADTPVKALDLISQYDAAYR